MLVFSEIYCDFQDSIYFWSQNLTALPHGLKLWAPLALVPTACCSFPYRIPSISLLSSSLYISANSQSRIEALYHCCLNTAASPVDLISTRLSIESRRLRRYGALMNGDSQTSDSSRHRLPFLWLAPCLVSTSCFSTSHNTQSLQIKCPSRVPRPVHTQVITHTWFSHSSCQKKNFRTASMTVSVHKLPILFHIRRTQRRSAV